MIRDIVIWFRVIFIRIPKEIKYWLQQMYILESFKM